MRRPRSVLLAGRFLGPLHVWEGEEPFSARLRARGGVWAFEAAHHRIVPDTAAASTARGASGQTATDCGFAARCADLGSRRGRVRPRHSRLGLLGNTRRWTI
jgi:hypothetical protein